MRERWQYSLGKHPAYCTCVKCQTRTRKRDQPQQQYQSKRHRRQNYSQPKAYFQANLRRRKRGILLFGVIALLVGGFAAYVLWSIVGLESVQIDRLTERISQIIDPTPTPEPEIDLKQLEDMAHELINAERVAHGLEPLNHVDQIRWIARSHSQDMATYNFFSHVNLQGLDPTDRAILGGYDCRKDYGSSYTYGLAENIHQGWLFVLTFSNVRVNWQSPEEMAKSAVDGWMNSQGHRDNILSTSYDRAGIGVAIAKDGKVFFTQNFC